MSKKMIQALGLITLLFVSYNVLAQESPSVITNTDYYNATRYNNNRKSARTTDGTIMAIWEPNGTPSKEVYYSIYDADFLSWGDPEQLSNSGKGDTGAPGIIADDDGNIYACWKQYNEQPDLSANKRDFMFAKWDGASWSDPVIVETDTSNCGYGSIAKAPSGDIFIAYTDYGTSRGPQDVHACWSTDDGVHWDHVNLTNKADLYSNFIEPCLTSNADGDMICFWYDEPDTANKTEFDKYPLKEIMISIFKDGNWSAPTAISPMIGVGDTLSSQYPSVITDSKGQIHITYTIEGNYLYHGLLSENSIINPVRIDVSADSMDMIRSCISVDENDNLYVVWQQQTIQSDVGNVDNAFYATSKDGGATWSVPVQMSDCTIEDGSGHSAERPSVGLKIRGKIEGVFEGGADVVWAQYNADSEFLWDLIYYRIPLVSTGIENAPISKVDDYSLAQNYPNPFNPNTEIKFNIPRVSLVELSIFNTLGQKVKTLINGQLSANNYTFSWDGKDEYNKIMPSGIYFYRLKAENSTITKRMVFLR